MTSPTSRRNALAAIMSLPVAAKEAAAKMAMASGATASSELLTHSALSGAPVSLGSHADRVIQFLTGELPPWKQSMIAEQARAHARILDADLASFKSVSPAAAYTIQRRRCERRLPDLELMRALTWREKERSPWRDM